MGELTSVVLQQNVISVQGLYREDGRRKGYNDLSPLRKQMVKQAIKDLTKKAYKNLKGKTLVLKTKNDTITVGFPKEKVGHLVNDIMMKLGGGNFTENNIVHLDEILKRAKYVDTPHNLTKERGDTIRYFFRYRDRTGKEVDFKVAYDPNSGNGIKYYPYAVNDKGT